MWAAGWMLPARPRVLSCTRLPPLFLPSPVLVPSVSCSGRGAWSQDDGGQARCRRSLAQSVGRIGNRWKCLGGPAVATSAFGAFASIVTDSPLSRGVRPPPTADSTDRLSEWASSAPLWPTNLPTHHPATLTQLWLAALPVTFPGWQPLPIRGFVRHRR